MNFVVAVLLLVVDEETAFWCLATVVEKLLPGHFCGNMAMSLVDQGVLRELLARDDPQLMGHLDELQVVPSLVSTQWLLTCFVGSAMPLSALLRLWDCMFYEGQIAFLFRVCGALIKLHRRRLLATDNAADAYQALISLGAKLPDVDALIDAAYALPWDALLQPRQLAGLRQATAQRMVQEQAPAADQAAAATAVAAAAVAEAEAKGTCQGVCVTSQLPTALAAAPRGHDSGWTLVPVPPSAEAERQEGWQAEEWNLVERERKAGGACASSLSYVIVQLQTPSLVEAYFDGNGAAGTHIAEPTRRKSAGRGGGLIAQIMGRLDSLVNVHSPQDTNGTIVIAF